MLTDATSTGPARRSPAGLVASALLGALALAAAACGSDSTAAGGPSLTGPPAAPAISRTLVTADVAATTDCTALAGSLVPLFASLGDLSNEEVGRLDPAVIQEIGTYLEAIETKRLALDCGQSDWISATCQAMADADSALAEQFMANQCVAGPRAVPPTPSTTAR
ncbi:MAG: hypothetical protein IT196_18900 [Acidimicrobiales bacterium]|nr:hypothetical protein [Acidimicrobiales bacterium]